MIESVRSRYFKDFLKIACNGLSAPLFIVFWGADLFYAPQYKYPFLALRVAVALSSFLVYFFVKSIESSLKIQWAATFYTFANAMAIWSMVFLTGGAESQYYVGLNLVATGIITFLPWSMPFLFLNLAVVYLPYFFLVSHALFAGSLSATLVVNVFFCLGFLFVTFIIRSLTERNMHKEIYLREKLMDHLKSQDETIRLKTEESIDLKRLASQFSPQVVEAIKTGKLNLNEKVHRTEVCTIFVDIVNSTERVVRIDFENVDKVITMFIEDVASSFLKYDITIDKFLGDGVLGFSNDPVKYDNFAQRVVDCGLEILAKLETKQEEYLRYWKDDFKVRIGISLGYANIGFYGTEQSFKSYTAIGEPVNLACRLSDQCRPNEMLLSENVVARLKDKQDGPEKVGPMTFKGFDQDKIIVYRWKRAALQKGSAFAPLCENGHGVLVVHNENGIFVFRCRECDFALKNVA